MNSRLKLIALICVTTILSGCTDDNSVLSENNPIQCITLQLPKELNVEVTTRSIDENLINDVLTVIIRNGVAKYERFLSPSVIDKTLSLQLASISPKKDETLHIFCNTGLTSVNATTEDELLQEVTCNNNQSSLVMYGSLEITDPTNVTIELLRVLAKAELSISSPLVGYSIESWEMCNVPSAAYVAKTNAYPIGVTFTESITPDGQFAYFLPRTDNDNTVRPKTFILLKLTGGGWYRLDFYNGVSFLPVNSNTHYAFTITSVLTDGYDTKKEAEENAGSNIEYNIEATYNSVSNGQYLLQTNKDEILLYPVGGSEVEIDALEISAIIPGSSVNNITTYTVSLVNPSKHVTLVSSADLYEGVTLTTENSKRTVRFSFSGADVTDSYLDIKLGNVKKRIPIRFLSSNSYLVDFGTTIGTSCFVPLIQANMDGITRITSDDLPNVQFKVIWSDQPDIQNKIGFKYDGAKKKMWFEVVNKQAFTGNVVVAAILNGVICWSWHIWALDNSVLEYNTVLEMYDFKVANRNEFNNFIWMDRNLGALNVNNPSDRYTRGLMYQWGRKDPFPGGGDDVLDEPTIYSGMGEGYTMTTEHSPHGGSVIVTPDTDDKLKYSIEHPMHFMKNATLYGIGDKIFENDWYSSSLDERRNDFWESNGRKGVYDPCPVGWRVPVLKVAGPWVGLWVSSVDVDASGMTWSDIGYYPWTARRTSEGSLTSGEGSSSTLWWGSGNESLVNSTRMMSTEIVYMHASLRAFGYSVRCVKEEW